MGDCEAAAIIELSAIFNRIESVVRIKLHWLQMYFTFNVL